MWGKNTLLSSWGPRGQKWKKCWCLHCYKNQVHDFVHAKNLSALGFNPLPTNSCFHVRCLCPRNLRALRYSILIWPTYMKETIPILAYIWVRTSRWIKFKIKLKCLWEILFFHGGMWGIKKAELNHSNNCYYFLDSLLESLWILNHENMACVLNAPHDQCTKTICLEPKPIC